MSPGTENTIATCELTIRRHTDTCRERYCGLESSREAFQPGSAFTNGCSFPFTVIPKSPRAMRLFRCARGIASDLPTTCRAPDPHESRGLRIATFGAIEECRADCPHVIRRDSIQECLPVSDRPACRSFHRGVFLRCFHQRAHRLILPSSRVAAAMTRAFNASSNTWSGTSSRPYRVRCIPFLRSGHSPHSARRPAIRPATRILCCWSRSRVASRCGENRQLAHCTDQEYRVQDPRSHRRQSGPQARRRSDPQ